MIEDVQVRTDGLVAIGTQNGGFKYITPFSFVMPWNWRKGVYLPHLKDKNMSSWERKLLGVEI